MIQSFSGGALIDTSIITGLLKNNPQGMSLREIAEAIEVNRVTVARHLDVLMVSGKVEMIPFGQAKVFYLSERVPVSSLVDCVSDIVLVVDDRMKIRQLNTAFINLFGGVAEDYYGISILDAFYPEDVEKLPITQFDMALRGRPSSEDIAINLENERIDFKLNLYPSVFENGKRSVSIVMTDISGLKRSDELNRINAEMVGLMSAVASPDEIYMVGAGMVVQALKAAAAAVYLKNDSGRFFYHSGAGNDEIFSNDSGDIWERLDLYEQINSGSPAYYSKGNYYDGIPGSLHYSGDGLIYAYPLFRNGTVSGFIAINSSNRADISDFERKVLEAISCQISCALNMENVFKGMEEQ